MFLNELQSEGAFEVRSHCFAECLLFKLISGQRSSSLVERERLGLHASLVHDSRIDLPGLQGTRVPL